MTEDGRKSALRAEDYVRRTIRHYSDCLARADAATRHGLPNLGVILKGIELDLDNIVSARERAVALADRAGGDWTAELANFGADGGRTLASVLPPSLWRQWSERRAKDCASLGNARGVGVAISEAGIAARTMGDLGAAREFFIRAGSHARWNSDHHQLGQNAGNLAIVLAMQGQHARAARLYRFQIRIVRSLEDHGALAAALNNLGMVLDDMDQNGLARDAFSQAKSHAVLAGDRPCEAAVEGNLGSLLLREGNFMGARSHYGRQHQLSVELNDTVSLAHADLGLACVCNEREEYREAAEIVEHTLPIARRRGDPSLIGLALATYATALRGLGRLGEAKDAAQQAQKLLQGMESPKAEWIALE